MASQGSGGTASTPNIDDDEDDERTEMLGTTTSGRGPPRQLATRRQATLRHQSIELEMQRLPLENYEAAATGNTFADRAQQQQNQEPETWLDQRVQEATILGNLEGFKEALTKVLESNTPVTKVLESKTPVELCSSKIVNANTDGLPAENGCHELQVSATGLRKFEVETAGTVLHLASAHGHLEIVQYLVTEMHQSVDAHCDSGSTPICLAVARSHLPVVEFLSNHGAKLDKKDKYGRHFLQYAILSGKSDTLRRAMQIWREWHISVSKEPVPFPDEFSLMLATRFCSLEEILRSGENTRNIVDNAIDLNKNTVLHMSCSRSTRCAVVQLLLEVGASLWTVNLEKKTSLDLAVEVGAVDTIEIISQYLRDNFSTERCMGLVGNIDISDNYFPKRHLTNREELKIFLYRSELFAKRNTSGKSPWDYAVEQQSNNVWKSLLKAAFILSGLPAPRSCGSESPSIGEFTGQEAAVESNVEDTWLEKVQYFVIVRSCSESTTPLHMAASKGDVEKLQIMLNCNFRLEKMLDSNGNTFLHTAAKQGQADVIRTFAKNPRYVNQRNKNGDSVLSVACSAGRYGCIKLLLHFADLSLVNEQGRTALHELCVQGDLPMTLLQQVVQLSAEQSWFGKPISLAHEDKTGCNVLHLLAGNRNLVQPESVFKLFYHFDFHRDLHPQELRQPLNEALYNHCVDNALALMNTLGAVLAVNALDNNGLAPLHVAVRERLSQAVKPLVECGADLGSYDKSGNSPLHALVTLACEQPELQKEYIELLREILDCAVIWYCKRRKEAVLSKNDRGRYPEYYKTAVTRLLTAVYNGYRMNVLMWAAYKCIECKELLSVLLTVPDVFCTAPKDEGTPQKRSDEYTYDVTNIVPATMTLLPYVCRVVHGVGPHHVWKDTIHFPDGCDYCCPSLAFWWRRRRYPSLVKDWERETERPSSSLELLTKEEEDCCEFHPMLDRCQEHINEDDLINRLTLWNKQSLVDIIVGTYDCFREERLQLLGVTPIREITMDYSRPYKYMYGIIMIAHLIYMGFFSRASLDITASADLSCADPANRTSVYLNVSNIHGADPANRTSVYLNVSNIHGADPANRTSVYSNFSRMDELHAEWLIWPCLILFSNLLYCIFYFWRSGFKRPHVFLNWSLQRAIRAPFRHLDIAIVNVYWFCGIAFSLLVIIWFVMNVQRNCHQDYFLAMAMVTGWLYVINFTQSIKGVYHFSLILQHIVLKDLFKFSFVFASLLVGYAYAFKALTLSFPSLHRNIDSLEYTFFDVFHWLIGMGEFYKVRPDELASHGKSATMMNVTFVSYVILLNVVLLNLLVAIMNNTFSFIYKRNLLAWQISSLQHILDVENHYPFVGKIIQKLRIPGKSKLHSFLSKMLRIARSGEIVKEISSNKKRFLIKVKRVSTWSEKNETPGTMI